MYYFNDRTNTARLEILSRISKWTRYFFCTGFHNIIGYYCKCIFSILLLLQMKTQLQVFKSNLVEFARKYRKNIIKDPVFRQRFQTMCSTTGVDPLACNLQSFYYLFYYYYCCCFCYCGLLILKEIEHSK